MPVSIARAWRRRHAALAAVVLAAGLVVGHAARSGASVGDERSVVAAPLRAAGSERASAGVNSGPTSPPAASRVELEPIEIRPAPNPLLGLTGSELDRLARTPSPSLGSVCFGRPNRGRLFNGVELTTGPGLRVMVNDDNSWGTVETVRTLRAAAAELRALYPTAPDVLVGDLSRARGGYLRPHRSHQRGLDADLGYFYGPTGKWYTKARADNLDRELTWAFLKALIGQGGVEYVFMDRSVQALLRDHALRSGEDPAWVVSLFETPGRRDSLIRHTYGHITHFHVRFLDPRAERLGRALEGRLRRPGRR